MSERLQSHRDQLIAAIEGSFDPKGMRIGLMSPQMSQLTQMMERADIDIPFSREGDGALTVMKDEQTALDTSDVWPHLSDDDLTNLLTHEIGKRIASRTGMTVIIP